LEPSLVGEILCAPQQRFPFMPRQPAVFKIGARPFTAVIEEADVVVGLLDWFYFLRDELIELGEIGDEVSRQCKIHGNSPRCRFLSLSASLARKGSAFD